jgi:hypothetical protein
LVTLNLNPAASSGAAPGQWAKRAFALPL